MAIKVLTVEDSTLIRLIINQIIKSMDGVELVGTAENGIEAVEKVRTLKPDVVTMDIVMPEMDGLEALEKIREFSDVPIIMLSAQNDQDTTMEALENGAQDFLSKPENISKNKEKFKDALEAQIKALANATIPVRQIRKPAKNNRAVSAQKRVKALAIGASTGGPRMISAIVQSLPANMKVPIFIVQHMPAGFTASFAKRLDGLSKCHVVEAEDGMAVVNGTVYIAPGGKHMVVSQERILLLDTEKINNVKPAVDPLFKSVAEYYGEDVLAVILTGMGKDGTEGCKDIKAAGGHVIAQDEETSIVYGMPKSAFEAGVVDEVLSIDDITYDIKQSVRNG